MTDNNSEQFADELRKDIGEGRFPEWAEVYALNAVSEDERTTIEDYISSASGEVRAQFLLRVRQARETITAAYATDEADPPEDLLPRIITALPARQSSGTAVPGAHAAAGTAAGAPAAAGSAPSDELAMRRHRRADRGSSARRWIIGAAAAAVLAIGSVTVAQNVLDPSVQERVAQADDVYSATLNIPAGGTADIARSDSVNAAVVTLHNVPAPEAGKVYQMWRLPADGSAPESVCTMSGEDVAGTKITVLENIERYAAVAITVEPEGGSETPTMPIVAQIPLDA